MKEGWKYKKLGDIATYINGFPFKPTDWKEQGKPIIRIQNLTGTQGNFNRCSRTDIPEKYLVKRGDILISWSATLGVFEWNSEDALLNQHIFKVVFDKEEVSKQYFKYAILMSISEMSRHTNGATMKHIRKGDFDNIRIPFPPLSEQQSIVDYLDSVFAKIDAMKANAEKALNEAKALFQASLKEMLEPKEGWEENTLKNVSVIYGNYGLSVPSTEFTGVRYLRITDITEWGELNDEKVSAKIDDGKEQGLLEEGDLLFARTGATVGKTLMYKDEFGDCLFAGYLIRYRLKKEIVNPKFMFYITHSDEYYKWVLNNQKAAAQPNISAKLYNDYKVSYPPLSEQQSIVSSLDSLKSKVDRLQANFAKISQECDALKQAILRQVFSEE